ncbi:hypothetical protein KG112_03460 [Nocardioides sp. zg-ZUI104]|uniref:hypothetical protein n=1 Tax=Nocardioides faecalis TaxID=2803858 RepID=UPI001BCFF234|nr:hypothetical protein [Nocardioides faecalis]MBS4751864.1 hypothetical protein [Nocardioides faecalis]
MPERAARTRDERGATTVLVALCTAVLVMSAAFVVDLGMQRVLRRDLQAVVDVVALDLARELTGKTVGEYTDADREAIDDAMAASLARNASLIGGEVSADQARWAFVARSPDGTWEPAGSSAVPEGVEVVASSSVGFAFGGLTGTDRGAATRKAVAAARTSACLKVSSYAAQLDSQRSWLLEPLLGDLLGTDLALQVLDPEHGLAGVQLNLLDLIAELDPLVSADISAASFTEAAGVKVGLSQLMLATVRALEKGSGRLAEIDLLRNVYNGVQANLPAVSVELGDLVDLGTAQDAAATLGLDVLDLLTASLALADGTNVLSLPLGVRLPLPLGAGGAKLVDLNAKVKVGQKPVVACSGKVESSQIEVDLSGDVLNLDLGLIKVHVPVSVRVTLADASALVRAVRCVDSRTKRVDVAIDSGLLGVDVRLGQRKDDPTSPKMRISLLDIGLPGWRGIEVVSGTIALTSSQSASRPTREASIEIADEDYSATLPAATGGLGIPRLHVGLNDLTLLGGLGPLSDLLEFLRIPSLLQQVTNLILDGLVNPLVATLDTWLLDPLLRTLGVDVAGGTVQAAPTVDCGLPRLVG